MRLRLGLKSGIAAIMITVMMVIIAAPAALAQESKKVAQVVVTGNQNINRETIEHAVKLVPGSQYSAQAVEKDRQAIEDLGYFSVVSVRTEDTSDGTRVIYDVVENPVVKDIAITGSGPVPAEKIKSLLKSRSNQVLNLATLRDDAEAIQGYYSDQGYFAIVTEDIGIDKDTGVLTIPILVNTVESVDIIGNKKTREYVFLREMKTKPGDLYNRNTLRNDIARIYNLDIIEDIQTPKIEPGSKIGTVAIAIAVTEKKTGNVALGLGYSSQSQLVGRAELSETNLRGKGQGLTLLWETAAAAKGSGGNTGSTSSYDIGFVEPWIDKNHTSLSVNVFNKLLYRFASTFPGQSDKINGQTYNERRKGASVGLSRPLTDFTRAYFTLRGETVETSDIPTTLTSESGLSTLAENGPIRSGTLKLVNNTRDFDRDPAMGWYKSASLELGTANVTEQFVTKVEGVDVNTTNPLNGAFSKFQFDVRRYWSKAGRKINPSDKRTTIAARLTGGYAAGQIPFFEQYFVGGSDTLRGYREDRFWGNKMFVASLEYRRPIAQAISGVLFADYGDAWGTESNFNISGLPQSSGFSPKLGVGVGMRINTPIGNLRLDYGIGSDGARTHFSIGQAF